MITKNIHHSKNNTDSYLANEQKKAHFIINSTYSQASNPNTMRDMGGFRNNIVDLQLLMNQ